MVKRLLGTVGLCFLVVAIGVGAAVSHYGSLRRALAMTQGHEILCPVAVDAFESDNKIIAQLPITNCSNDPVTLIGGYAKQAWVVFDCFPMQLQPGETEKVEIVVVNPIHGFIGREVQIYTTSDIDPILHSSIWTERPK